MKRAQVWKALDTVLAGSRPMQLGEFAAQAVFEHALYDGALPRRWPSWTEARHSGPFVVRADARDGSACVVLRRAMPTVPDLADALERVFGGRGLRKLDRARWTLERRGPAMTPAEAESASWPLLDLVRMRQAVKLPALDGERLVVGVRDAAAEYPFPCVVQYESALPPTDGTDLLRWRGHFAVVTRREHSLRTSSLLVRRQLIRAGWVPRPVALAGTRVSDTGGQVATTTYLASAHAGRWLTPRPVVTSQGVMQRLVLRDEGYDAWVRALSFTVEDRVGAFAFIPEFPVADPVHAPCESDAIRSLQAHVDRFRFEPDPSDPASYCQSLLRPWAGDLPFGPEVGSSLAPRSEHLIGVRMAVGVGS